MKYLVVILLIILLIFILKKNVAEKFNQELQSPEVIEVIKNNEEVYIKFKNISKKEKKFMIFYINSESPQSGIWVEKKIKCEKEICEIKLNQLLGKKYHLVIVETDGNNTSPIGKIIKFGDNNPYIPYFISPMESKNINGTDINGTDINGTDINGTDINGTDINGTDINGTTNSPSPYVICGSPPKVKYVNNETQMDNIEVKTKCKEDENIPKIKKKISRNLWNEFKKGYLSVDLNLVN